MNQNRLPRPISRGSLFHAQNKNLLVSIIIPTKNEQDNIKSCIQSCLNQTYKKIEIIVIDNFSKDKTVEIAKKSTKNVYQKGPERSAQRNFGASIAKGDFLLFVDADMELEKNLVKNCLSQNSPTVVIPEKIPHTDFWSKCRDFEKTLYLNDSLIEAPRFIKKSLFEKLNGYNPKFYAAEDLDLSQRFQKDGIFPAHANYFLIHHESISLINLMKKKFYYGQNLIYYTKKSPQTSIAYVIRPAFIRNYKKLVSHPFLSLGMFSIKTLEYASVTTGFIYGHFKKIVALCKSRQLAAKSQKIKKVMNQPYKSKMGEVIFRQKLITQHLGKEMVFLGQPDQKQITKVLSQRVENSRTIFKNVSKRKISLSPFLEIGAEKCQRAALLSSEFNAQGFALDISFESLKSAKFFTQKLDLKKLPILICADAENLPFENDSLPFVFAFETLHHFPNPKKVLREMKRVTASRGYVYFSEEPVKQTINLPLWRRDFNLNSFEKILRKLYILPFLSILGASETKYNVIENQFSLSTWKASLKDFEDLELTLEPVFWGPKNKTDGKWQINPITRLLIALEGGGITALAKIQKTKKANHSKNIFDLLACPSCHKKLKKETSAFACLSCQKTYPVKNNVIFLLDVALRKKLYPNIN